MRRAFVLLFVLILLSGCLSGSSDEDPRTYQLKYGRPPPPQTPKPQISPEMQAYMDEQQAPVRNMYFILLALGAYYIFTNRERWFDRYKGETALPAKYGKPILLRPEGIFEITHVEPMNNGMVKLRLDDGYQTLEHQVYDESSLIAPEAIQFLNSRHPLLLDYRWLYPLIESLGIELDVNKKMAIKNGLENKALGGLVKAAIKKQMEGVARDAIETEMASEVGRRVQSQLGEVKELLKASQEKGGARHAP